MFWQRKPFKKTCLKVFSKLWQNLPIPEMCVTIYIRVSPTHLQIFIFLLLSLTHTKWRFVYVRKSLYDIEIENYRLNSSRVLTCAELYVPLKWILVIILFHAWFPCRFAESPVITTVNHGNHTCCQNDSNTDRCAGILRPTLVRAYASRIIMHLGMHNPCQVLRTARFKIQT